MHVTQRRWTASQGWIPTPPPPDASAADLVFVFGATSLLQQPGALDPIRAAFPTAHLLGGSTAGEICGAQVFDDSIVATAVRFAHTRLHGAAVELQTAAQSFAAGAELARKLPLSLPGPGSDPAFPLAHVLVFSDGTSVNGSDLVRGLIEHLPVSVPITGGMAGDGSRFAETYVFWDAAPARHQIVVLGLYGSRLQIGFSSVGGWDPFGPDRLVTRASGNVLFELDGRSALGLYKEYLGDHAKDLPAAGLLFPLCVRAQVGDPGVVRTILGIDETAQSLTFAGDVPEGSYARLMKANFDRLIDGAAAAARRSREAVGGGAPALALLISCVGRKLLLKQRIEEELEGVREVLGTATPLAGFYSYGEICPFTPGGRSELHNQTMTITTFAET